MHLLLRIWFYFTLLVSLIMICGALFVHTTGSRVGLLSITICLAYYPFIKLFTTKYVPVIYRIPYYLAIIAGLAVGIAMLFTVAVYYA